MKPVISGMLEVASESYLIAESYLRGEEMVGVEIKEVFGWGI
jgi:hypothetical protein